MSLKSLRNSFLILLLSGQVNAQFTNQFVLPNTLEEISGLEALDDSTLIAINDGGNAAEIYLLDTTGRIIQTVELEGVKNKDWEDLATDEEHLYIADIGNNENKRKSLSIWIVDLADLKNRKKKVTAEEIKIKYKEQQSYPPSSDSLFFDAEAITVYNDSLWLFTKPKSDPWNGNAFVYVIPAKKGEYELNKKTEVLIGDDGWWSDALTAADYYKGKFYLMTYNRIQIYRVVWGNFILEREINFDSLSQKESILVINKESIFVADEKHSIIGGGNLYKLDLND